MSDDRLTIETEQVARLIASQCPQWADAPVRRIHPGGWDNRSFRLGADKVVRLPSARRYAAQPQREAMCLSHLAAHLPVAVPVPLFIGVPGAGYPFAWSIKPWFEGAPLAAPDDPDLAEQLATLLRLLRCAPAIDGLAPGVENFHRGGDLAQYDGETRAALQGHGARVQALEIWEAALAARATGPGVWVHGDVSPGNVLVLDGRITALIDFGSVAIGDPACDLAIAWSFFEGSARDRFVSTIEADPACWARARGWALWKAAITDANGALFQRILQEKGPLT